MPKTLQGRIAAVVIALLVGGFAGYLTGLAFR